MSGGITVISRTQTIIVEPTSGSVSIINTGPQGPAGPPGAGGGPFTQDGSGYIYNTEPSTTGCTISMDDGTNIDLNNGGDFGAVAQRDIYLSAVRDINVQAQNNINMMADGSGANKDVNIGAGRDIRMDASATDQIAIKARNTPATDARINNESFVPYLDVTGNAVKLRVRLPDGSYETVTLPFD